jgi:hypothetical protein
MKKLYFIAVLLLTAMVFSSCQKDPTPPPTTAPVINYGAGLGTTDGYPTGKHFALPQGISIIGEIRGGIYGKAPIDKTYKGPFNYDSKANYVTLGTGTFVNLYMTLYNSTLTDITFTMPGGLIFIDSADAHQHEPVYQKGYILQDVEVIVPALDTSFIDLRAYCLNHTLAASSYYAVYYIGPITNNPQLNMITNIMDGKQYPYGEEYNIQTIIWNVTDYGLILTSNEIAYLNALP